MKSAKKNPKSEIKYSICNHKLYSESLRILNDMTGVAWGFVRPKRKITHVTSETVQYRIGIASQCKKRLDHEIRVTTDMEQWCDYLALELKTALLYLLKIRPQVAFANAEDIIKKISTFSINKFIEIGDYSDINVATCKPFDSYTTSMDPGPSSRYLESANDELNKNKKYMPKILSYNDLI